uniref:Ribonuclease H-like domain, reverse transcriptase, RNA-dependent DNA polymerase n=1 Tax=Tanacetum cinerariifolium TaxID=118510 RepID=A0A6L2KXW0_TANCI|nr:ribonuclease H-like domain, reverse transcriptase, RNA-dependent DNA polymerase [Tanacetum cinerariifolium]
MARLAFCDYHNMIAILEKYEHNTDFYQIVDFVEASHLRYALTINPTVYVSHIQQFWSTVRIETTDEGTKILATVDGQFSHQWKYLIHTIMQCLSPKSTGFNEFSSNIATALVCLATNRVYNFSKMIFDGMVRNQDEMVSKITAQDLEISQLKARIKLLEDKDGGADAPSGEDATIKGRRLETGEEVGIERSTEKGSDDTEEMYSPAGEILTISVPSGSGMVPTASLIFSTATVATLYSRRKGKEKMVESDTPKKKKLQEQIDVQVAREMEEQLDREDQRRDEQIARDAEIARINAEEEL